MGGTTCAACREGEGCEVRGFSDGSTTDAPPGFTCVEGGAFIMGSTEGTPGSNDNERPVRSVTVSGFWMGACPVTQAQWREVMGNNPSYFKDDDHPVENVCWLDAVEYANKRSLREGFEPAYGICGDIRALAKLKFRKSSNVTWNRKANGYRLPMEAEWEYAARGGRGSPGNHEYSGSDDADEVAWYDSNSGGSTQPVRKKAPNALGLYDMSGNVWEWCWDRYADKYPSAAETDPAGASSGYLRVLRGGSSWVISAEYVRCSFRRRSGPSDMGNDIGFRLVRPLA